MISGCAPQKTAVAGDERWRLLVVPMLFAGHPMLLIGLACAAHSSCRCRTVVVSVPLFLQMNRSVPEYAARCMCRCSALRCPMERAAMPDGARCTCQRSALRFPAEKTAVRRAAWQVGLHASLSTFRECLPPGRTVQSAFLLFLLGTQAGPSFSSSAKAEARHMRWHGLASWVFSAGQSGCLCGVWGCVRAP